jgi:hypothetical protein
MLNRLKWKTTEKQAQIRELEALLEATLVPVTPRPQFVLGLGQNLLKRGSQPPKYTTKQDENSLLLILAGFVSAAVIVAVAVRLVGVIVGIIGLLQLSKDSVKQRTSSIV